MAASDLRHLGIVLRLSVVGAELNLYGLPHGLCRMHLSSRANVYETFAVTDRVVGESLITESNVAPHPTPAFTYKWRTR
jgi:hypothetical protein